MIIYDLKCGKGHMFEGWFKDREAWSSQNSQKLVSCPVCGGTDIEIIPSSITIMGKGKDGKFPHDKEVSPAAALQMLHHYIDKNFEDVGDKFAETALRIHYGDEEKRNIKGTSTPREEENLKEEGIKFIKIPYPKMDS